MPVPGTFRFGTLWDTFRRNQAAAGGIGDAHRAAFITSMTLGLSPQRPEEISAFGNPKIVNPFASGPAMARFYLRAEQLASRLTAEWGHPDVFIEGKFAEPYVLRRRGVIYFENRLHPGRYAYAHQAHKIVSGSGLALYSPFAEKVEGTITGIDVGWPASVGHIDLWNGERTGRGYGADTVRAAEIVWLWMAP